MLGVTVVLVIWLSCFTPYWHPVSKDGLNPSDLHAIIATSPYYREDVWLSLAGALRRMGVQSTLFTECDNSNGDSSCVRFGLLDLARDTGMLDGRQCDGHCSCTHMAYNVISSSP